MVWCGVNQMIIHFSGASILPSVRSSIYTFLQIILRLYLQYSASPKQQRRHLPSLLSAFTSSLVISLALVNCLKINCRSVCRQPFIDRKVCIIFIIAY